MAATADAQLLNYVARCTATRFTVDEAEKLSVLLMPKVSGKEPIHMIYSPASSPELPSLCVDFLLYVAQYWPFIFCYGSRARARRGDVNQNNFMVGRDSKVVMIDSDSFQINANGTLHLCEVGVSHFTPPELQTMPSFVGFRRTEITIILALRC